MNLCMNKMNPLEGRKRIKETEEKGEQEETEEDFCVREGEGSGGRKRGE